MKKYPDITKSNQTLQKEKSVTGDKTTESIQTEAQRRKKLGEKRNSFSEL